MDSLREALEAIAATPFRRNVDPELLTESDDAYWGGVEDGEVTLAHRLLVQYFKKEKHDS